MGISTDTYWSLAYTFCFTMILALCGWDFLWYYNPCTLWSDSRTILSLSPTIASIASNTVQRDLPKSDSLKDIHDKSEKLRVAHATINTAVQLGLIALLVEQVNTTPRSQTISLLLKSLSV